MGKRRDSPLSLLVLTQSCALPLALVALPLLSLHLYLDYEQLGDHVNWRDYKGHTAGESKSLSKSRVNGINQEKQSVRSLPKTGCCSQRICTCSLIKGTT